MMKMNSLTKTLTRTPTLRLSSLSLSSVSWSSKFSLDPPPQPQPQPQPAAAMEENHKIEFQRRKDWPKPSEIPFQSKVANWVNLIGSVQVPVKFITLPDGQSWAGTLLSQGRNSSDFPHFWIPIIFEGDLAHTAAKHLRVQDIVHIAGQLCPDALPINLTNDRTDIQVMVHDIHFVRGLENMKYFRR